MEFSIANYFISMSSFEEKSVDVLKTLTGMQRSRINAGSLSAFAF